VRRAERLTLIAVVALAIAAAAAGCGQNPSPTSGAPGGAGEAGAALKVMVPCGQVGPFSEIVKIFQRQNPGLEVEWIPENMVTITNKLLNGKEKADVTLSMGDLEIDILEKAGLLMDGTRVRYAENSLAIMVPTANPAGVKTVADLAKPSVRTITIPDPKDNSAGVHALEALRGAGIWDAVEKKILFARFAADSKDVAAKGQAEASIGYYPCAVEVHIPDQPPAQPKNLKLATQIPDGLYTPFGCEGAVLKEATNPEAGKKLLALLQTPESQEIFKTWQFIADVSSSPAG